MKPTFWLRQVARALSESFPTSVPATVTWPDVGRSIPAIRLSSVVFPEPDGPISAMNSPSGTWRSIPSSTVISWVSRRYTLRTPRTSTIAMPSPLDADGVAILEALGRARHEQLPAREALPDHHAALLLAYHRHSAPLRLALDHLEDHRLAVAARHGLRGSRHHARARRARLAGRLLLDERHLGAHLRLQVLVLVEDRD